MIALERAEGETACVELIVVGIDLRTALVLSLDGVGVTAAGSAPAVVIGARAGVLGPWFHAAAAACAAARARVFGRLGW